MTEICAALDNEDYTYHLSGDCTQYCKCKITGQACLGRTISDSDDQSSQFFSRAKCSIDMEKIKRSPAYGCTRDTLLQIFKDKKEKEIQSF